MMCKVKLKRLAIGTQMLKLCWKQWLRKSRRVKLQVFWPLVLLLQSSLVAGYDLNVRHVMTLGGANESLLSLPTDVAVSRKRILVVDGGNHRIAVFNLKGRLLSTIGEKGSEPGNFLDPVGIGTDKRGRILVADKGNHRIQIFNHKGRFLSAFAVTSGGKPIRPIDVAYDAGARLFYVTGNTNHRVMVFDVKGRLVNEWGGSGAEESEFNFPATLTLLPGSRIGVVDVLNTRVQLFDLTGKYQSQFGDFGTLPGRFFRPKGIGVDEDGRIFVSDSYMGVIQVFSEAGEFQSQFGAQNSSTKLVTPTGITVSGDRIFVTEMIANRVTVYELD
jgi:tripartite motif-containing protein 71